MLKEYLKKRKFDLPAGEAGKTPEPKPAERKKTVAKDIFVIQKHAAKNLHYDLRLEISGVLKSWAVPKGVPQKSGVKNLAIQTEDHPIEYADFEGKIPKGEYGAGTVKIWDKGNFELLDGAVEKGHLQFKLRGDKLKGVYNLIKFRKEDKKNMWLIFKTK